MTRRSKYNGQRNGERKRYPSYMILKKKWIYFLCEWRINVLEKTVGSKEDTDLSLNAEVYGVENIQFQE